MLDHSNEQPNPNPNSFHVKTDSIPLGITGTETLRMSRDNLRVLSVKCAFADELRRAEEGDGEMVVYEPSVDQRLGKGKTQRYAKGNCIGEGASGRIFSLPDRNCRRNVAVKVMKPSDFASASEEINRFVLEAGIVASLEHPNIIPVYDVNCDTQGRPYVTMREIEGHTLREYLDKKDEGKTVEGLQTIDDLIFVFLKICDALQYAHSRGHVHQDIKPDNVMVGGFGEVFVIDWGASASSAEDMSLTPVYMSPQQAAAETPTITDDIFCVGATLFHCLTGRHPTLSDTLTDLWEKRRRGVIDPLSPEEMARVPGPLLAIACKAMALCPLDRYQDMAELARDLKNYQAGLAVSAYADSILQFAHRLYRRNRHFVHLVAVVLFFAGIGAFWGLTIHKRTQSNWVRRVDFAPEGVSGIDDVLDYRIFNGKPGDKAQLSYNKRGLRMDQDWLWVKEEFPGDLRLEVTFAWDDPEHMDGLDICFNMQRSPVNKSYLTPPGYLLQLGGYGGDVCFLSRIPSVSSGGEHMAMKPFVKAPDNLYHVVVEHVNERIQVWLNGKALFDDQDPMPLTGDDLSSIALRPWAGAAICLKHISVFTRRAAMYSSPIEPANKLFECGHLQDALREYNRLASDFPSRDIRERAMARSIMVAHNLRDYDYFLKQTEVFEALYPDSGFLQQLRQQRILYYWLKYDYRTALDLLDGIRDHNVHGMILQKLVGMRSERLPKETFDRFLQHIARHTEWPKLDLSGMGLTSLEPIANMKLVQLNCSNNPITSLEPLRGMPLRRLTCGGTKVEDLSPLRETPLRELNIKSTPVAELPPLQQLESLVITGSKVEDLSPLADAPMKSLSGNIPSTTMLKPILKPSLEQLSAFGITEVESGAFAGSGLKRLLLVAGKPMKFDASELIELKKTLNTLTLANFILVNQERLGECRALEGIQFHNCRIEDLDFIRDLDLSGMLLQNSQIDNPFAISSHKFYELFIEYSVPADLSFLYDIQTEEIELQLSPEHYADFSRDLLATWKRENNPHYLEAARYIYKKVDPNPEKAVEVAFRHGQHRYIELDGRYTYEQAKEIARQYGGKILMLESEEELVALSSQFSLETWLGLFQGEHGLRWQSGVPLTWKPRFRNRPSPARTGYSCFVSYREFCYHNLEKDECSLIIEIAD